MATPHWDAVLICTLTPWLQTKTRHIYIYIYLIIGLLKLECFIPRAGKGGSLGLVCGGQINLNIL